MKAITKKLFVPIGVVIALLLIGWCVMWNLSAWKKLLCVQVDSVTQSAPPTKFGVSDTVCIECIEYNRQCYVVESDVFGERRTNITLRTDEAGKPLHCTKDSFGEKCHGTYIPDVIILNMSLRVRECVAEVL